MRETLFIIGVISLASFANNVISFYGPAGKFDWLRSRCFCSKEVLTFPQLIPLFSFLFLKGKCGKCRESIPFRYFLVEFVIISLGLLLIAKNMVNGAGILSFLVLCSFIVIMFTDYLFFIIPNSVLIFMIASGLYRSTQLGIPLLTGILISFSAVLILTLLTRYYETRKQKQIIGYGDIKLIGLLFILYPVWATAFGIWLSAATALITFPLLKVFQKRFTNERKIPFGFFLSLVFLVIEFFKLQYRIESFFSHFLSI